MQFHEFAIPAELNGEQLKAELGCDEVYTRADKLIIGGDLKASKLFDELSSAKKSAGHHYVGSIKNAVNVPAGACDSN